MQFENMKLSVAGLLAFLALLSSCATTKISDLYEFYEVESEGESKLFGYRFVIDPNQRQPETSKRLTPDRYAVSFDDMRKELEKYMEVFPYCTQGYFVYDESFDGQKYILSGECQESK